MTLYNNFLLKRGVGLISGDYGTLYPQVMPQLLYYLKLDSVSGQSIDWGTLLVYCCAGSCGRARGYCEEFLWRQDFSQRSGKIHVD